MQKLSSFPTLNDELIQKIKFQPSPFRFFYTDDNGDEQELTAAETGSSVHPLTDEHGRWSPDQHGFGVSRTVTINSASFLFGPCGVVCKDAVPVLALLWKSPDSRQRSAVEIGELADTPTPQTFTKPKLFHKPQFKGRLDLQTAVVLKRAGHPGEDERHLANIPGTVLGVIDTFSVLFDGTGSMFPVNIINDRDGLLWSVECDFDDPTLDKFVDTVSINLNSAHPDYMYISPSDKAHYNSSFLREVLAGALATIVDCVRETDYWDDIKNGQSEDESVGQAVYYFITALNLNLDDAKQCSVAFRNYVEQQLGEL